jgi:hypothetical protein
MFRIGQIADNMHESTPPEGASEARAAARTNLFMAATLLVDGVAYSVTIRDLSTAGAKIESSLPLEIGSEATLSRGAHSVQCRVSWCTNRRCGLHFTSPVLVREWMASPVNQQQQRVDHVVAAVKAGAAPFEVPAAPKAATRADAAEDLKRVSLVLEILGDALASDPAVVKEHGVHLQNLDIALQTLTVLAVTMQTDDPECAASAARLAELRTACTEAVGTKC